MSVFGQDLVPKDFLCPYKSPSLLPCSILSTYGYTRNGTSWQELDLNESRPLVRSGSHIHSLTPESSGRGRCTDLRGYPGVKTMVLLVVLLL